jgi:hypothetical protein
VLLRWRKRDQRRGEEAFTEKQPSSREEALEARVAELERFCGKLFLDNELLKKALKVPLKGRHAMIASLIRGIQWFPSALCAVCLR